LEIGVGHWVLLICKSMKAFNREMGKKAEDLAVKALVKKGFQIIKRNFQNKFGEIDIIAKDKDILVFVEV